MNSNESNPVSKLNEMLQIRGQQPRYELIRAMGASHAPTFCYQLTVGEVVLTGKGNSKKKAKTAAALAMIEKLQQDQSINQFNQ